MNIKGKYNEAVCYLENMEETAQEQIKDLCDNEKFKNSKIRVMPDCHAGAGCTIGTTMTLPDRKVIPEHVGVDIGCGVTAYILSDKEIDYSKIEKTIKEYIPSGFNINDFVDKFHNGSRKLIEKLKFLRRLPKDQAEEIVNRAARSIGTLGGGNHFIEIDENPENKQKILVVHSGSRNLGVQCCKFYQRLINKPDCSELIDKLKSEHREKEIETKISKFVKENKGSLNGKNYEDYVYDLRMIQSYAEYNRVTILSTICIHSNLHPLAMVNSTHNYIDFDVNPPVLRKGAISAKKDETVIIPFNMKDGLIIAKGLGNPDWNCSAPHGAGRKLSRKEANNTLSLDNFIEEMKGIYTESANKSTLDEAPGAYKDFKDVYEEILEKTITSPQWFKPVYNYKHHES